MAGQNNFPFVINVGNSIIGVTILAMPFCFKACGIILGSLLLLFSTWLTLVSCHLLLKAGITSRRRSYSFLAYFTHGASGKLIVEIGMIGLQLGTLVAQVVIIGDLGPAIVSKFTGLPHTDNLRTGLIIFLCLFLGLPLGLLKDVRMLSKTSTACIMFYTFFCFYVIIQSIPNLVKGQWYEKVTFWRMEGFFQCLPIFSFAFGCQTQMFIVYDALAEPSLKRMNSIVSSAVNMCALAYLLVGFFGNVAFCDTEISGDIINHFKQNSFSDGIKLCFVFSIAVSIPLIVFPCRLSLYNLLFPQKPKEDVPGSGKIPEFHFKVITISIIVGSMVIGIMVPNVEFVLGLNGATMGTLICYIFPALFFLNVMYSSTEGKWTARLVLVFGLTILIASTYTTLSSQEKKLEVVKAEDFQMPENPVDGQKPVLDTMEKIIEDVKPPEENKNEDAGAGPPVNGERQEPPNPLAPVEQDIVKKDEDKEPDVKLKDDVLEKVNKEDIAEDKSIDKKDVEKKDEIDDKLKEIDKRDVELGGSDKEKEGEKEKKEKEKAEKEKLEDTEKKQEAILGKLAEQQEEQQKLIQEQKQILEELKQHKEEHIEKEKKEASDYQQQKKAPGQNLEVGGQQVAEGQVGGNQQMVLNQQLGEQNILQQQPIRGQQLVQNQLIGGQQILQDQPVGDQQLLQNQPVGGQQKNQQVGGQQILQNQPVAGQQVLQNQPIGGQQVLQNQPVGGQQVLQNQPIGGQQILQNQLVGGQQVLQNQPVGGQQVLQNQPVGGQQVLQNQPVGGQQVLQNQQPVEGKQILQNMQPVGGQVLNGAQKQVQNQPILVGQPANQQGDLQNDLSQQKLQQVPVQAQGVLPAGNAGGQLGNGDVQAKNVPAGNIGNIGLQNIQEGQQQVGNQVGVKQDFAQQLVVRDNLQNADVKLGKIGQDHAENPMKEDVHKQKAAVKDDTLKRIKRDLEFQSDPDINNDVLNVPTHKEMEVKNVVDSGKDILKFNQEKDLKKEPEKGSSKVGETQNNEIKVGNLEIDVAVDKAKPLIRDEKLDRDFDEKNKKQSNENKDNEVLEIAEQEEVGNIQRDLRQIKQAVPSDGVQNEPKSVDYFDEIIDNMKKNLYSDGNRKSPFVVEMVDKGKSR